MSTIPAGPLRKPAKRKKAAPAPEPTFACPFCSKRFRQETTIASHICEAKRRHLDRDEKHVKLAFWVYQKFHEFHYRGPHRARTYEQFAASQHYSGFVRFARFLLNSNVINHNAYLEFLFKGAVPLDKWAAESIYQAYLRELNKRETPFVALERSILLLDQWAQEAGEAPKDFFRKIAPPQAVLWIRSGRISPWLFYSAASSADLVERLSKEQRRLINEAIDPAFWRVRLAEQPDDYAEMKTYLAEFGM